LALSKSLFAFVTLFFAFSTFEAGVLQLVKIVPEITVANASPKIDLFISLSVYFIDYF
jgi:hypothetical protein